VGSTLVRHATHNAVATAYAGAWGESLGYSAVIIGRDFVSGVHKAHAMHRSFGLRGAGGVAAGLLAEFGPAGVLDTFVIRPLAMGIGQRFLGPQLGLLAGKLAADVLFYIPVILIYERRRHWHR